MLSAETQAFVYRTVVQLVREGTMSFDIKVSLPAIGIVLVRTIDLFDTKVLNSFVAEIKNAMIVDGSLRELCEKYGLPYII